MSRGDCVNVPLHVKRPATLVPTLWAIEGTGSFGAGLTAALLGRCQRIVEVHRPQRPARRGGVTSDDIDAVRAARQAGG